MTNLRGRKKILFQYVAAAILVLVLFPGQASAEQGEKQPIKFGPGSAHPGTTGEVRVELEAFMLAGDPHACGIIWDLTNTVRHSICFSYLGLFWLEMRRNSLCDRSEPSCRILFSEVLEGDLRREWRSVNARGQVRGTTMPSVREKQSSPIHRELSGLFRSL